MRTFPTRPTYLSIAGLAFAASATSLSNGFALDDLALVASNERVHSLNEWWQLFATAYWPPQYGTSLYRPIVALGYAVQWTAGHGAPWVFHAVSVAMYVGVCVLAYALFRSVLPAIPAVIAGALFAVHPVHVEAVANVVGQAELIAAIAILGACVVFVRARQAGPPTAVHVAAMGTLFGVACLAKEHALLLPALLALLEIFAIPGRSDAAELKVRLRQLVPLGIGLAAVALCFVLARTLTLGELVGEKPLVPVSGFGRVLAMLAVAPHWIRLFFWPAHLSADYSPQHIAVPTGIDAAAVAGLVVIGSAVALYRALGTWTLLTANERRAARLAIAWTAIMMLPVSNLVSVMLVAERTLLVPSVGAMLMVGVAASAAISRARSPRAARIVGVALPMTASVFGILGVVRSRDRSRVWRDNETLFAQTVLDAPDSYRAQLFYGEWLFESGNRAQGERHLRLAIQLNPTRPDVTPLNYLATQYRDAGLCPAAIPLYEQAIANDPERPDVRYGLAACLLTTGRVADGKRLAQDGARRGDLKTLFEGLIARADSDVAGRR